MFSDEELATLQSRHNVTIEPDGTRAVQPLLPDGSIDPEGLAVPVDCYKVSFEDPSNAVEIQITRRVRADQLVEWLGTYRPAKERR